MTKDKKTCFVISPIGEEGSDTRKRSDQVLKHVIAPAAEFCGYEAIRADMMDDPGMITSQIIQSIIDSPLVIADLTESNPNVFYELAIRHAIRKPLVQLIQKGDKIPFDVAGMRTIQVDHKDLDSVDEAKKDIEKQIKSVESKSTDDIDSPITVSIELQALRQSDNPEQRSMAEFVSVVGELRSDIAEINHRFSDPRNLLPPEFISELFHRSKNRTQENEVLVRELMMLTDELQDRIPDSKEFLKIYERIEKLQMRLRHRY